MAGRTKMVFQSLETDGAVYTSSPRSTGESNNLKIKVVSRFAVDEGQVEARYD